MSFGPYPLVHNLIEGISKTEKILYNEKIQKKMGKKGRKRVEKKI